MLGSALEDKAALANAYVSDQEALVGPRQGDDAAVTRHRRPS